MIFDGDIHGPRWMNPSDFGDPLMFHLAAVGAQSLHFVKRKMTDPSRCNTTNDIISHET